MHEAEDLTEAQEAELVTALHQLVAELERTLAGTEEDAEIVDLETPIGRIARMDAMQAQKMAQASRSGLERRLNQARQALKAVDDMTFGECRRCEEPIGYRRLKARPETPFCLGCQSAIEERKRG